MRVGSFISGLKAQNQLLRTSQVMGRALERLSSGKRINSARDDASGLAVSIGLESQVRGLGRAALNINESMGYLQTADGLLSTQVDLVQRMRELAVQASNGILSSVERESLDNELQTLLTEFERVANDSQFGGHNLFDGSLEELSVQVGSQRGQSLELGIDAAQSSDIFTELRGTGAFSFATSLGSGVEAQVSGDFDRDGRDDLVTVDGFNVKVNLANDSGGFQTSQEFTTIAGIANSRLIQTGDFDGDGVLDLVLGDMSGVNTTSIYLGRGDGTFTFEQTIAGFFVDVEVADFNADGKDDILGADTNSGNLLLHYGDSDGVATTPSQFVPGSVLIDANLYLNMLSGYNSLESGDFNNDGRLDFAITDGASLNVQVQSGEGIFSNLLDDGATGYSVEVADLNEDGYSDLIHMDGSAVLWTPFTALGMDTKIQIATDASSWISVGDFNNDDNLDLLLSDTNRILFGSGADILTQGFSSQSIGVSIDSHLVGDFNGDGILDISDTSQMRIYHGVGNEESAVDELDLQTQASAQNVLEVLDNALSNLVSRRSELGISMNRLESVANSNMMLSENLKSSLSLIRDADLAEETAELVRAQVLQQAQIAALSQANLNMQTVLLLFR